MAQAEIILFWSTVFIYVLAFCAGVVAFVRSKTQGLSFAVALMWAGFAVHTALGIVRWYSGGHAPVANTYELNITGTWFTILVFLLFQRMGKTHNAVLIIIAPIVFLILGQGYMLRSQAEPMSDAYNSLWLIVHVIFAWLAFGSYAISTGTAILLLLRNKIFAWRPEMKIPEAGVLDAASYRFIVLGFINHVVMLISGAIWARKLWGYYWNWDPLETWSLISFLFYAFYLHARAFLKWKYRRAAWLAMAGLIILAISFWGVGWFAPSVHPGP